MAVSFREGNCKLYIFHTSQIFSRNPRSQPFSRMGKGADSIRHDLGQERFHLRNRQASMTTPRSNLKINKVFEMEKLGAMKLESRPFMYVYKKINK